MRSIDQRIDHLKNQILDGLTQKGILNELQSRFLSNVAQFIQTTDYDVFKPHRERRQTPEYEIAEIIVAQYLKTKNMTHTLQSIQNEFKIDEKEIDPDSEKSTQITKKIKIEKNGLWIHQIVNDWNKNKEVLIKQNKEYDRQMVKNRLHQIDNKSEDINDVQNNENENFDNDNIIETNEKSSLNKETEKIDMDFQEEEEIDKDSDSQNEKPGKPIWIVESPTAKENSSEFVSDDNEPPSIFSKQENKTETKSKENETNIQKENLIENAVNIPNNNLIEKISDSSPTTIEYNDSNENEKVDDFNQKATDNIKKQNSIDFDVDFEIEEDPKVKNQSEVKNQEEKFLSDDFDEPQKPQKKEIKHDDFDDFDDFDQEIDESPPKTKQNVNSKPPTIESDIDLDANLIESDPPVINSNNKPKSNVVNNDKTQASDSSLDFSSASFDENDDQKIQKEQPKKQTKKVGNNSSTIDFDIDFSDDSPSKTEKKKISNVNENSHSDFDIDFSDDSPAKTEKKNISNANESNHSDFDDFDDI